MTKSEFIASKESDQNILKIIEDTLLKEFDQNTKEYLLSYLEKDENDKVDVKSIQYYEINNTIYLRP